MGDKSNESLDPNHELFAIKDGLIWKQSSVDGRHAIALTNDGESDNPVLTITTNGEAVYSKPVATPSEFTVSLLVNASHAIMQGVYWLQRDTKHYDVYRWTLMLKRLVSKNKVESPTPLGYTLMNANSNIVCNRPL